MRQRCTGVCREIHWHLVKVPLPNHGGGRFRRATSADLSPLTLARNYEREGEDGTRSFFSLSDSTICAGSAGGFLRRYAAVSSSNVGALLVLAMEDRVMQLA